MTYHLRLLLLATTCLLGGHEVSVSLATENRPPPKTLLVHQGSHHQLTYLGQEKIPAFEIDGLTAHIHTQGIFTTAHSLYVSGRWEQTPPRALFLRFNRKDLRQVEFLDITPQADKKLSIPEGLDHPGGFDYDGKSFWIPVAISKPHSFTAIVRIHATLDAPLANAKTELAFTVDDHVGALVMAPQNNCLIGANWDSKIIFHWHTRGTEIKREPREEFLHDLPDWALAIQDWKYLSDGIILASGYDKDPRRKKSQSRATLDWLDIRQHRLLDRIRILGPDQGADSLTREGMSLRNDELFLLPDDLGNHAILYRYRLENRSN